MKTHEQTTCATRKCYNSSSFILWFTPFISSEIKNMVIIIITINIIKWPIPVFKCQIKQSAIGGLQIYTLTLFRNGSLICYDLEITLWMCCTHVNFPFVDNKTKLRWKHIGKSCSLHINAYNSVGQVSFQNTRELKTEITCGQKHNLLTGPRWRYNHLDAQFDLRTMNICQHSLHKSAQIIISRFPRMVP